jgi:hypothetical protein
MSTRVIVASFADQHDALEAVRSLRRAGQAVRDVYSPHAIHGMDEALGLRPTRLTWVCFVCGAIGLFGMLWFQNWANSVDWPINVGGKPWNSLPAEAPVAFEMLVLLAAFGSVLACLAICRLYPGKRVAAAARVADDRYAVAVDASPAITPAALRRLLAASGAVDIEEQVVATEAEK